MACVETREIKDIYEKFGYPQRACDSQSCPILLQNGLNHRGYISSLQVILDDILLL